MASKKNITMKQYNGTDYDTLYPKTNDGQVLLTDSSKELLGITKENASVSDALSDMKLYGAGYAVGDTLTTVRPSISDSWLLCNGSAFDGNTYPELAKYFTINISNSASWTTLSAKMPFTPKQTDKIKKFNDVYFYIVGYGDFDLKSGGNDIYYTTNIDDPSTWTLLPVKGFDICYFKNEYLIVNYSTNVVVYQPHDTVIIYHSSSYDFSTYETFSKEISYVLSGITLYNNGRTNRIASNGDKLFLGTYWYEYNYTTSSGNRDPYCGIGDTIESCVESMCTNVHSFGAPSQIVEVDGNLFGFRYAGTGYTTDTSLVRYTGTGFGTVSGFNGIKGSAVNGIDGVKVGNYIVIRMYNNCICVYDPSTNEVINQIDKYGGLNTIDNYAIVNNNAYQISSSGISSSVSFSLPFNTTISGWSDGTYGGTKIIDTGGNIHIPSNLYTLPTITHSGAYTYIKAK